MTPGDVMLLPTSDPRPPGAAVAAEAERPSRTGRRGATAMEYLVCASFILVVLIAGVQHLASVTQSLFQKDADATNVLPGGTER
jgi:Flp pilus assembly pilin Flp